MIERVFSVFHKTLHPLLLVILRMIRKHQFDVLNEHPSIDGNAIYAVNHSNRYDIIYVCEAIKRHCYVLIGRQPLYLIDRIALILNGAVWVDRKDRADKKKASTKMIRLLRNGNNVVIFPEGTWNLTPSKPLLHLYWGIIDITGTAEVPIIPVIMEYTEKKCYISFGSPIKVTSPYDKNDQINRLADAMATLKWKTWEVCNDIGCKSLCEWNEEVERRIKEYPKLDYSYECSVIRKEFTSFDELIDISKISPNKHTAFLFRKD